MIEERFATPARQMEHKGTQAMAAKIDGFDFSEASAPQLAVVETQTMQLMSDADNKKLFADGNQLVKAMNGKTETEKQQMMKAAPIWIAAAADWIIKERTRLFSSAPQKKAPMKKPQRTKAPLSSSAPSLQHKAKAKKKGKPAFATHAEQTLLAAVLKFGNNYQLAKLAGTTPDILSRFARKDRTLRLDTAGQVAAALGIRFQ